MNEAEKLLDIKAVSELIGLPVKTIYQYVHQRRLPVYKISSRCLRFRLSDIMLWLESKSQPVQEKGMSVKVKRPAQKPRSIVRSGNKNRIDALVESAKKEVLA